MARTWGENARGEMTGAANASKPPGTIAARKSTRRSSLAILASFAVLFSFAAVGLIRQNAPTYDESYQLFAGYTHLKWGDFRVYPEHPPLGKMLTGLPLLLLDIKDPRIAPFWDQLTERNGLSWGL